MTSQPYRMPGVDVPVVLEVDVVVAGGGFAGVCAAVAAARTGAKVAIVERDGLLGGQAAEVYTFGLDAVFGDAGCHIIKGLPWEIIRRAVQLGDADPSWTNVDAEALEREGYDAALAPLGMSSAWKSHAWIDRSAFRHALRTMCREEAVTVLLEAPIAGAMLEGDRATGVIAQGDYGPYAIAGSVVVDTTPSAAVAAAAGHPFPHPEVYLGTHPHVSGIDIERLIDFACERSDDVSVVHQGIDTNDPATLSALVARGVPLHFTGFNEIRARAIAEDAAFGETGCSGGGGSVFYYDHDGRGTHWLHSEEWRHSRLDAPLHLSRAILGHRHRQWLTHEMFRRFVPGFERARLEDVHPHIARSLLISKDPGGFADYDVSWEDIQRGGPDRDDRVIRVMGHPGHGQPDDGWMLPYAAMLPKGLEGLLVTGKPACRFIHYHGTVGAVGHAAGVAGGLAALGKLTPRNLDSGEVREELRRQGAVVE